MKMNTCSGCGGPVPARRKSITGDHWCKEPACQSKRQTAFRRRRAEDARDDANLSVSDARLHYFRTAMDPHGRRHCDSCGRDLAVLGYAHLDRHGEICLFLGRRGAKVGKAWIRAAYPEDVFS